MKTLSVTAILFLSTLLTRAEILITEFQHVGTDQIEFINTGEEPVDISNWQLCHRLTYAPLNSLTVVSGSLTIQPGEFLVVSGFNLNDQSGDIGLYSSASFGNPDAMQHFVQYGAGGIGRESVAVTKGIWTAGAFVEPAPEGSSIALSVGTNGSRVEDWFIFDTPTFGEAGGVQLGELEPGTYELNITLKKAGGDTLNQTRINFTVPENTDQNN